MIFRTLLVTVALLGSAMAAEPTLEKRLAADRTFRTQRSVRPWAREARGRMTEAKLRQRVRATLVAPPATVPIDTGEPTVNVAKKPVIARP
jgi:hypothetical protein